MLRINNLMGLAVMLTLWACGSSKQNLPDLAESNQQPTLSVWGFSCELGGRNCGDLSVGKKMQRYTIDAMQATHLFNLSREEPTNRRHLIDISDMLWKSGESDMLKDIESLVQSEYLMYGRVIAYNQDTRDLQVGLTLVHRASGERWDETGEAEKGNLSKAVQNAVQKISDRLQ